MGLFKRDDLKRGSESERKVAETEIETNDGFPRGRVPVLPCHVRGGVFGDVLCDRRFRVSVDGGGPRRSRALFWRRRCALPPQWERVVILRFGRFSRIAGPGLYCCIPFAEYAAIHVDCRIATASFSAEAALTADLVPVDVDAILFWMVWDAKKACLEVENYPKAVLRSAQTAMRDVIGQLNLADISMRRKQIDRDLEEILGKKCEQWGVTVMSVEIRDIMIPRELQDALSKEAQAERERNARIVLAEVEKDISEMFVEAAEVYDRNPRAMRLRAMNLAYEGAKDSKGVLLAPSALADGFNLPRSDAEG